MRSYEAARTFYSFLGFFAWCLIVVGVLGAFAGSSLASQTMAFGRGGPGIAVVLAFLPGAAVSLAGFLMLAIVQTGRAAVDTAEYSQQMLKVARDQLEVSRQGQRQATELQKSFESLRVTQAPVKASADFADLARARNELEPETKADASMVRSASGAPLASEPIPENAIEYRGRVIREVNGEFRLRAMRFASLDSAKRYIDQLGVNPNAQLTPIQDKT